MANFTKKAIVTTFIDLLNKKPLSHITVKEITEICEINHNTFYYYFKDIYQIIDVLFNEELQKLSEVTFSSGSLNEACTYALDFIYKNKKAIRNIYNSVSRDQLQCYLRKSIDKAMDDFSDRFFKDVKVSEEDKRFFVCYHKYAILGGILNWLESRNDDEFEIIIKKLSVLTEQSIASYIKNVSETLKQ